MLKLNVSISAKVYDKHGKLVRKYRPKAAHSFLAQFIEMLHAQMANAATSITQITGAEDSIAAGAYNFQLFYGASLLTGGMLIGSGDTPVDINDYALETKITADLTVSAHTYVLSYPTASSRRLAISRVFTNASIAPMAIEEVAIYVLGSTQNLFCIDRTLYSVAIPASSSLELTYRITVSV